VAARRQCHRGFKQGTGGPSSEVVYRHKTCVHGREVRRVGGAFEFREELSRLLTLGGRHRRLFARLVLALALTSIVFLAGTLLIWSFETGQEGGQINGLGDAAFFTGTQLLTVSSSITNPVTTAGKITDLLLEAWAISVVTAAAGSFASFFNSADST
jgi:hypothetical protein